MLLLTLLLTLLLMLLLKLLLKLLLPLLSLTFALPRGSNGDMLLGFSLFFLEHLEVLICRYHSSGKSAGTDSL